MPDPTLLTIDSIRREIEMVMTSTDDKLSSAERLTAERFSAVDAQLERSEELRREQKSDTKAAVDAALQAQVDATAKMERSISDQISSLRSNFETEIRSIRSMEDDMKNRMTIVEASRQGQTDQRSESRAMSSTVVSVVGVVVAVLLAVLTVYSFIANASPPPMAP